MNCEGCYPLIPHSLDYIGQANLSTISLKFEDILILSAAIFHLRIVTKP
jgi:hypothetical protein